MPKRKKGPIRRDKKYLVGSVMLYGLSVALAFFTYCWWMYGGSLPIIVPVGAGVCLLMGSVSLLQWVFGDSVDWE